MIITDGSYSMDHVRSLADALLSAGVAQPLTFPVRAGIAASDESQTSLLWLLKQVDPFWIEKFCDFWPEKKKFDVFFYCKFKFLAFEWRIIDLKCDIWTNLGLEIKKVSLKTKFVTLNSNFWPIFDLKLNFWRFFNFEFKFLTKVWHLNQFGPWNQNIVVKILNSWPISTSEPKFWPILTLNPKFLTFQKKMFDLTSKILTNFILGIKILTNFDQNFQLFKNKCLILHPQFWPISTSESKFWPILTLNPKFLTFQKQMFDLTSTILTNFNLWTQILTNFDLEPKIFNFLKANVWSSIPNVYQFWAGNAVFSSANSAFSGDLTHLFFH